MNARTSFHVSLTTPCSLVDGRTLKANAAYIPLKRCYTLHGVRTL